MIVRMGLNAAVHVAGGILVGGLAVLACAYMAREMQRRQRHETMPPPSSPTGVDPSPDGAATA